MKTGRKTWSLLLAAVLAVSAILPGIFGVYTPAAEALQIGIDGYEAEEGQLKVYVNQNQGGSFMVKPDDVAVTFGANEMKIDEIRTFGEVSEPISYKCVIDVSGSMDQKRIDSAKDTIKKLAQIKKPEDKIAITAMGNELTQSGYMTDPDEIGVYADMVTVTREDTNLYYAVTEELKGLQTSNDASGKQCLVIFSDGADYQDTGLTREEAEKAAEESGIPIFTVGLLKNAKSENDKEMAKVLGSFARLSPGGVHYAPALDDSDADSIAQGITDTLNSSFVIYTDLSEAKVSGKEVALKVSVSSQYGETATDTINVPESDVKIIDEEIKEAQPDPTPQPTAAPAPEPEPEPEPVDLDVLNIFGFMIPRMYAYIGAGVLLLLAVLLIVLLTVLRKKEPEPVYEDQAEDRGDQVYTGGDYTENESVTQGFPAGQESVTMPVDRMDTFTGSVTVAATGAGPKPIDITLVRMGLGEEKNYKVSLGGEKHTIGRSATQSKLAFTDDNALSGLHCSLSRKGDRIFIKDEKSTNGTFVNGVPIEGQFELNQDDVILIGSYEYRISWK